MADYKPLAQDDEPVDNNSLPLEDDEEEATGQLQFPVAHKPSAADRRTFFIKLAIFALAVGAAITIYFVPIMNETICARHTLAVVIIILTMWVTEVAPVWASSLLVPILVVWLGVYQEANQPNQSIPAKDAAKRAASTFFSSTVMLAFGAFTISAALTKKQLSDRLAYAILSRVGTRPLLVTLAIMGLGLFLAMWISNVASPVVCLSVIRPLLRDLPADEPFVKFLLLAIAYANNIGGMTSPISSPQNILSSALLRDKGAAFEVPFIKWLGIGVIMAIVCSAIAFGFLWLWFRPKLKQIGPIPEQQLEPFTWSHAFVLFVSLTTIVLWALNSILEKYIGGTGIVGMIPVVLFFGTRTLTQKDFKELPWDVLMLLAGGMVLGDAISDPEDPTDSKSPARGLLVLIANELSRLVAGAPVMAVNAAFSALMFIVGNFVSHTVSAIILIPVIWGVAVNLGNGDPLAGHAPLLVLSAAFIDSGAMGLPVSSFPNAQMYSETDRHGRNYLTGADFIKTGFFIGILECAFLVSVGYFILLGFGF